jgi:hypothetical protein
MTEEQLREWLDRYGQAWEACNPDAAAALFSEDAEYYETPFGPPSRGRQGVRAYWAAATGSQRDVSFTHQILSVSADRGIARWAAEFTRLAAGKRMRLDGVFVLDFGEDGLCRTLREWWHHTESTGQDA